MVRRGRSGKKVGRGWELCYYLLIASHPFLLNYELTIVDESCKQQCHVVIAWSLFWIWGVLFELLETKDTGLLHLLKEVFNDEGSSVDICLKSAWSSGLQIGFRQNCLVFTSRKQRTPLLSHFEACCQCLGCQMPGNIIQGWFYLPLDVSRGERQQSALPPPWFFHHLLLWQHHSSVEHWKLQHPRHSPAPQHPQQCKILGLDHLLVLGVALLHTDSQVKAQISLDLQVNTGFCKLSTNLVNFMNLNKHERSTG